MMTPAPLPDFAIPHGGLRPLRHPQLGVEIHGQTAIKYLRFLGPARIDRLELPRAVYGRWVPAVPTHPAHLIISTLNRQSARWETIKEVNLPRDPRTAGEGLNQTMPVAEMEAHFAKILQDPPHVIELGGIETDHLRVVCDAEHDTWPSHGEVNGGPFNVPFGILKPLRAHGELRRQGFVDPSYRPILKIGRIAPDNSARVLPHAVVFESKFLSVGFSLRRPLLTQLGFDALGAGQAQNNRILISKRRDPGGMCGPVVRTLAFDAPPHLWTGEVSVVGNQVCYKNLEYVAGITVDATFTVEPTRLLVQLTQTCAAATPVLEAEAWRLTWDLTAGITGAAAVPTLLPGRNGDVELPAIWATDGVGGLSCRILDGAARLQVESYRDQHCVSGGFVLADRPDADTCWTLPAGQRQATLELAVTNLEPSGAPASPGVRRHWATTFACYRPELGGFSNNSASTNCHMSQGAPLEIVAHTRRPEHGPDPLALARFTVERALLAGGGYGYWRNLYLDSDPVLVSTAGRIHQAQPQLQWLRRLEPGLIAAAERMLGNLGAEGLIVCRDLTGNYGSFRWSSNAMDVVGFGHIDGYANAWTYRAFRNATALLGELAQAKLAARCRDAADSIRANYAAQLLNPATGWVAGWRSRDGVLHDYAFTWVNGVAIAFGLLDEDAARRALWGLEQLREQVGLASAYLGLPCNLLPIRIDDHMLPHGYFLPAALGRLEPTFENYTDGSLSGYPATYYLRALSIYELKEPARRLATELDAGYAAGIHNGGIGTGHEFRSWEGCPTGYEGTLSGCFSPMYSIAIELGALTPTNPEWWPTEG